MNSIKVFRALYSNSTIGPFATISSSWRIIRRAASSVARTSSFEKSADPFGAAGRAVTFICISWTSETMDSVRR